MAGARILEPWTRLPPPIPTASYAGPSGSRPWHFEDEACWVADCMVCRTPMIVWRTHGLPEPEVERALLDRLEEQARRRFGEAYWIDTLRRRIPDHWHAHARPEGGFFGVADGRTDVV